MAAEDSALAALMALASIMLSQKRLPLGSLRCEPLGMRGFGVGQPLRPPPASELLQDLFAAAKKHLRMAEMAGIEFKPKHHLFVHLIAKSGVLRGA